MTVLLPDDALAGVRVGISVSKSPDLGRLGLFETHLRLALAEIARTVVSAGGDLVYGGHLAADGYTAYLLTELQRYTRRDRSLLVCLAWQEHRKLALSELARFRRDLGLFGQLVCLDPSGAEIDPARARDEAPVRVDDRDLCRRALTSMRRYMRDRQHGRVLIGGRREDFQGSMPGVMEEVLLALEAGQPVYLAGGFGGATLDAARALGVDDGAWLPAVDPPPDDPRFVEGRARLAALARSPQWSGLSNGLSEEENRRLAASHRPSEVAALAGLGLGRVASSGG